VKLLVVCSVGLSAFGLYPQPDFMFAWLGMILTYLALVAYLGGTSYIAPVSLPMVVLALMMSPWYRVGTGLQPSLIELPLVATMGIASLLLLRQRANKKAITKDCEYCRLYRSDYKHFCLYCGRTLNRLTESNLGGLRKFGPLAVAAAFYPFLSMLAIQLGTPLGATSVSALTSLAGSYLPGGPSNLEAILRSGIAALGIIAVAAHVRTIGFRGKVMFDNTLGLDSRQYSLLALIAKSRTKGTGSELFRKFGREAGFQNWFSFEVALVRFKRLGLLHATVHVKNGVSETMWKCAVAI
jgi:hypothetical protein